MNNVIYYTGQVHHPPTLKELHWFKNDVSHNWYYLGLQLLDRNDANQLNTIKKNHPNNNDECCSDMFQLWLQKCSLARWEDLISALRTIGMNREANEVAKAYYGMYESYVALLHN